MSFKKIDNFKGVNRAVSQRDDPEFAYNLINLDTHLPGKMVARKGSKQIIDDQTTDITKFVEFRDEENDKDVILALDEDSTVGNRKLWAYTRTAGSTDQYTRLDGAGPPDHSSGMSYGTVELGDSSFGCNFLVHRNHVKIGTGTGANNKALDFGYYDRDNFFGQATLDFDGYFLTKQQFVQKNSITNRCVGMCYDSNLEKYYLLTSRGVEIRDTDFYLERVLNDVTAWKGGDYYYGGIDFDTSNHRLYVCGRVPGTRDTKVIYYEADDDYTLSTDINSTYHFTKQHTNNDYIHSLCWDGTNVYVTWSDRTNSGTPESNVEQLVAGTLANTNVYNNTESSSTDFLIGITSYANGVYAMETTSSPVIRGWTVGTWGSGTTQALDSGDGYYIQTIGSSLYFIRDDQSVKSVTVAEFGLGLGAISNRFTGNSSEEVNVLCLGESNTPHLISWNTGVMIKMDTSPSWAKNQYVSGKIHMGGYGWAENSGTVPNITSDDTFFYGVSIVDIFGQESHLITGCAVTASSGSNYPQVTLYANIESEEYEEQSASVSATITALNSSWNDFRKIKYFRIYRAFSDDSCAGSPTTNYRFLKEIDFDDNHWSVVQANKLYKYEIYDEVAEDEISTTSYEESSGLPEYLKPYYTNWKYAVEHEGYYYYGNVRTDDLYVQKFIKSPKNAPDMIQETDVNSEVFGIDDGDEIKGFGKTLSRIYVFKENTTALYNGLNKDRDYTVGCYAPDSIVNWQNLVYFLSKDGIYAIHPTGEKKISLPIDDFILDDTNLADMSAALFTEKEKILFLLPGDGYTYVYNYGVGTWDRYMLNVLVTGSPVMELKYITRGIGGRILFSSQGTSAEYIYEFNTGYKDGTNYDGTSGNTITLTYQSGNIGFAEDAGTAIIKRIWVSYLNDTDTMTVYVYYVNESSSGNQSVSLTTNAVLTPKEHYLNEMYVTSAYIYMAQNITAETIFDNFIIEYDMID